MNPTSGPSKTCPTVISEASDLYLDLLKRTLTRMSFGETLAPPKLRRGVLQTASMALLQRFLSLFRLTAARTVRFDPERRERGLDWPPDAETMIGLLRLSQLEASVKTVVSEGIPGDFIETGVWRGGACIFMRGALAALGDPVRRVFVADSFNGLPPPDITLYPADAGDRHHTKRELAIPEETVRENFRRYGLLDDRVLFLKGWFKETLPKAPIERLAILRLDGDMYGSTMDAIRPLYPKVSPGGFVIVDDYGAVPACRQAIHDYRDEHGITDPIVPIDGIGVYWRKTQVA